MAFAVQSTCGRSRTGQLATKSGVVETPALLLFARQGAPVNHTTENLNLLRPEARALQFTPASFIDGPSPKLVAGHAERLHGFVGLQGYVLFACLRDPFDTLVKAPNDQGVQVLTHAGMRKLRPADYMEVISALQPDAYVAIADEFYSDKPKRTLASVDRTTAWLKETAAKHKAAGLQSLLFASIQGGANVEHRAKSAQAAAAVPEVAGFSLGGFGLGETPQERRAALEASVAALPEGMPRHIAGLGLVEEILDAVEAGLDLVHSAYAHLATADACALCFPLAPPAGGAGAAAAGPAAQEEASDGAKLSMRHASHLRNAAPLVAGCRCFTCQKHTRAYVYHLVDAHEMLADVLLDMHNTHHMLMFFKAMREAIREGRFGEFAAFHRARGRAQNMGQLLAA